jgi:pyruvyl transferase EpsI
MSLEEIYRKVLKVFNKISLNFRFAYTHKHLRRQHKIIYALTPPSILKNIGDHAQAIAIHTWLKKQFPELPVIEIDKIQSRDLLPALRWLVQPADVLFLHSGGNMGDRGMWSEEIRRLLISSFPKNKIVSLPQTIYFSNTPTGARERENTRRIYAAHPNLTIMGRDPHSGELATELFPRAQVFCMPDFVLSITTKQLGNEINASKVLLCLRLDKESALTPEQRREIANQLPYQCVHYDTTLAEPIKISQREAVLEDTLNLFRASDAVVTDRYHGLIFAVLCRKPCVVLRTVDHKLTSAMHWFKDVSFIRFARNPGEIPALIECLLAVESREVPDWNANYFGKIPELVGLR